MAVNGSVGLTPSSSNWLLARFMVENGIKQAVGKDVLYSGYVVQDTKVNRIAMEPSSWTSNSHLNDDKFAKKDEEISMGNGEISSTGNMIRI